MPADGHPRAFFFLRAETQPKRHIDWHMPLLPRSPRMDAHRRTHRRCRQAFVIGLVCLAATSGARAGGPARPNLNADGFADIMMGCPGANRAGINDAGRMIVMYGNTGSINDDHSAVFHQNIPGLANACQTNDALGSALGWGDFNGDGFDDVATGVPNERIGSANRGGAVHVLYGQLIQVTTTQSQFWHQDRPGVQDEVELGDEFGSALAGGDFNADGFDDLAIGAPGESVGNIPGAGAVTVLYGSPSGLRGNGSQFIHQDVTGVGGKAHSQDKFGFALTTGDFNDDGFVDLAIGAPLENVQARPETGSVNVLYGSATGLLPSGSQYWHQGTLGVGGLEAWDRFGWELIVGDFNGDGFDDLGVGAPWETGTVRFSGAITVIFGSAAGLTATGARFIREAQVIGEIENDLMGRSLAAGDLNGDNFDELIVGFPNWDTNRADDEHWLYGLVVIINGSPAGPDLNDMTAWKEIDLCNSQQMTGGELLGAAITTADYNGDGIDDLAVGLPGQIVGNPMHGSGGAVIVTVGTPDGIEEHAGFMWGQLSIGQPGAPGDGMGSVLP
jgi:hypothetical protein